ncbi:MAG: hypothetical protein LBM70_07625 [Victivallales bacterium]|jgi:predicted transcriptional regulator|nr:hypothetical protein [Victivallales bacterium]
MLVTEFKIRYFEALLDFIWRQWTLMGIPGHIAGKKQSYVIDPEALLLFSAWFCRYDQRLYDLVTDYLRVNGDFINIQRLKSLSKKVYLFDSSSLGVMVSTMGDSGERRWTKFAKDLLPNRVASPEPLFLSFDGQGSDFLRLSDKRALQYGFIRNQYVPSGKTVTFPNCKATFWLQLRGAFGRNARSETILMLLNKKICNIQDIANISGFSWKSIQTALAELQGANIIATKNAEKRGRYYFLKNPQNILSLFEQQDVSLPDWRHIYDALTIIFKTVTNPRLESLSEQTMYSEIELMFREKIGESLLHSGIDALSFLNTEALDRLPDLLANL